MASPEENPPEAPGDDPFATTALATEEDLAEEAEHQAEMKREEERIATERKELEERKAEKERVEKLKQEEFRISLEEAKTKREAERVKMQIAREEEKRKMEEEMEKFKAARMADKIKRAEEKAALKQAEAEERAKEKEEKQRIKIAIKEEKESKKQEKQNMRKILAEEKAQKKFEAQENKKMVQDQKIMKKAHRSMKKQMRKEKNLRIKMENKRIRAEDKEKQRQERASERRARAEMKIKQLEEKEALRKSRMERKERQRAQRLREKEYMTRFKAEEKERQDMEKEEEEEYIDQMKEAERQAIIEEKEYVRKLLSRLKEQRKAEKEAEQLLKDQKKRAIREKREQAQLIKEENKALQKEQEQEQREERAKLKVEAKKIEKKQRQKEKRLLRKLKAEEKTRIKAKKMAHKLKRKIKQREMFQLPTRDDDFLVQQYEKYISKPVDHSNDAKKLRASVKQLQKLDRWRMVPERRNYAPLHKLKPGGGRAEWRHAMKLERCTCPFSPCICRIGMLVEARPVPTAARLVCWKAIKAKIAHWLHPTLPTGTQRFIGQLHYALKGQYMRFKYLNKYALRGFNPMFCLAEQIPYFVCDRNPNYAYMEMMRKLRDMQDRQLGVWEEMPMERICFKNNDGSECCTVSTQAIVDPDGELIIGKFERIIYGHLAMEEAVTCDITGAKLNVQLYLDDNAIVENAEQLSRNQSRVIPQHPPPDEESKILPPEAEGDGNIIESDPAAVTVNTLQCAAKAFWCAYEESRLPDFGSVLRQVKGQYFGLSNK